MSIPSTIAEYLSCFSQELGDRILQIYPALQAPQDPVSERFKTLLRSPFAAQRLAVMGIVKRWHRAKAAAVIAECGTGKTLMALSAIHVRSAGRPYTALVMAPPNIVGKWCREVLITVPGARVFIIDGLRTPGQSGANPHGVNEVRYRNGRIVREGRSPPSEELELGARSLAKDLPRSVVLYRWPRQGKAFLLLEALLRGGEVRPMPGDRDQS